MWHVTLDRAFLLQLFKNICESEKLGGDELGDQKTNKKKYDRMCFSPRWSHPALLLQHNFTIRSFGVSKLNPRPVYESANNYTTSCLWFLCGGSSARIGLSKPFTRPFSSFIPTLSCQSLVTCPQCPVSHPLISPQSITLSPPNTTWRGPHSTRCCHSFIKHISATRLQSRTSKSGRRLLRSKWRSKPPLLKANTPIPNLCWQLQGIQLPCDWNVWFPCKTLNAWTTPGMCWCRLKIWSYGGAIIAECSFVVGRRWNKKLAESRSHKSIMFWWV